MQPNFKLREGSYELMQFPSGELQVRLNILDQLYSSPNSTNTIIGSILCSDHIIELLQLVDALKYNKPDINLDLVMPYCAYSRQDRICNPGESFSLKVFTNLLNSCNFSNVITWDNHSEVSTALINNCYNISVAKLLANFDSNIVDYIDINQYDFFISPDSGANKKVFNCSQTFNKPMIRADKTRDVTNGKILETIIYATSDQLKNTTVLIIDDIAANGRTFEELAKAIKAIEPSCQIHLYVTHGFFNSGFNKLKEAGISKFYTTNSVPQVHTCNELVILSWIRIDTTNID